MIRSALPSVLPIVLALLHQPGLAGAQDMSIAGYLDDLGGGDYGAVFDLRVTAGPRPFTLKISPQSSGAGWYYGVTDAQTGRPVLESLASRPGEQTLHGEFPAAGLYHLSIVAPDEGAFTGVVSWGSPMTRVCYADPLEDLVALSRPATTLPAGDIESVCGEIDGGQLVVTVRYTPETWDGTRVRPYLEVDADRSHQTGLSEHLLVDGFLVEAAGTDFEFNAISSSERFCRDLVTTTQGCRIPYVYQKGDGEVTFRVPLDDIGAHGDRLWFRVHTSTQNRAIDAAPGRGVVRRGEAISLPW